MAADQQPNPLTFTQPFTTVSTMNAGPTLPASPVPGAKVRVQNIGGMTMNIWPASGAAINSASTNTAATVAVGSTTIFEAVSATLWAANS